MHLYSAERMESCGATAIAHSLTQALFIFFLPYCLRGRVVSNVNGVKSQWVFLKRKVLSLTQINDKIYS